MQKKFILNLILLLFLNLLIKPFWVLGIDRAVQKTVGTETFGEYFALFNFSFLLNIILDFGITNFNNKNIAQNNHLLTKHFSSLVVLKLLLAVIYILTTIVCGLLIGYDARLMKVLIMLGFNQFLISFIAYLRSNLAGLHLFKTDSVISVLDRTIMIAFCIAILFGDIFGIKMDIMWYVYGQTGAYFFTALITFFIVLRKTESLKLTWSLPFSLMILKKSFPFAVLVLLMTFYNRIDTVMLERMLPDNGARQAGLYAQGYRLLDAANMIAYLFSGLLIPIFSRMLKYNESVEQLVKLAFTLLITPAIIVATACIFYSFELMELMYIDKKNGFAALFTSMLDIHASSPLFSILMCCFVAISTTYIFGSLLTANGNLKQLNTMAASGMAVNIILNLILIPKYQALGSAMASLITQSLTALAQVIIAKDKFNFKVNKRLMVILFLFITGVVFINIISKSITSNWMLNFGIMCAACGIWAFATGIISIKSMYRMMKYG